MMHLPDLAATEAAGRALAPVLRMGDVIALSGELGAGKTSFARGVLAELGAHGEVPSPSYPLVVPYEELRVPIWHVDLYRLDEAADVAELGLDEALTECALIVEWPDRMGGDLWAHALRIHISVLPDGGRSLTVDVPPSWEGRCPFQ